MPRVQREPSRRLASPAGRLTFLCPERKLLPASQHQSVKDLHRPARSVPNVQEEGRTLMKKRILLAALGLVVVALVPAVAIAGDLGGACVAILGDADNISTPEGKEENAYLCADDFTSQECDLFCGPQASPEGGLFLVDCEWVNGATCEDVAGKIGAWEGACDTDPQGPAGGVCVLISEDISNWTAEEVCTDYTGGDWEAGGICGAPVPAMPRAGQAALVIVLMFGALVILNIAGIIRSA